MSKYERCRAKALKYLPYVCVDCGWIPSKTEDKDKVYKLSVHHKDKDRDNCKLKNLEFLCYPDHTLKHLKFKCKIPKLLKTKRHLKELMNRKNKKGLYGCEFCNHESQTRHQQKQHHWHCKKELRYLAKRFIN